MEENKIIQNVEVEAIPAQTSYIPQVKRPEESINRMLLLLESISRVDKLYTDLAEVLYIMICPIIQEIQADAGYVFLKEGETDILSLKTTFGEINLSRNIKVKLGEEGVGKRALASEPTILHGSDIYKVIDKKILKLLEWNPGSLISIPIVSENQILGIIESVKHDDKSPFTTEQLHFTRIMANYFGSIIIEHELFYKMKEKVKQATKDLRDANSKLKFMFQEAKERSLRDGLTHLYNHSYFFDFLEREIEKSKRQGEKYGTGVLILCDIDHFKKFNDTYGHQVGDMVLMHVAKIFQENSRKIDCAARYGGEEFALLLPQTPFKGGQTIAERLRQSIENSILKASDELSVKITISVGVSCYPTCGSKGSDIVEAADQCLYKAKESGRNRVIVCSECNCQEK
ncbi:MAG: GGDEF domain-containing protein [Armatimonadetes bacterium]|nr:GGDEF domain-containing protein [Armatimonadota bacterium]